MAIIEALDQAIDAHGAWKLRLQLVIATGEADAPVETVRQDSLCAFGKWLYGPTLSPADKASRHHKTVRRLHAEFHETAARVTKLALDGKKEAAEEMIDLYGQFTQISTRLARAMMEWKKAEFLRQIGQ